MGRGPIKAEFDSLRADHICGHGEMVEHTGLSLLDRGFNSRWPYAAAAILRDLHATVLCISPQDIQSMSFLNL